MVDNKFILSPELFMEGVPYGAFEHFRKYEPVFRDRDTMEPNRMVWNLVRYDDVLAALKDIQTFCLPNHNELHEPDVIFRDSQPWYPKAMSLLETPEHTIHKKRFLPLIKKENVKAFREVVGKLSDNLTIHLSECDLKEMDAVEHFSAVLTSQIVCSYFNIPSADHAFFRRLSSVFMSDTLLDAKVGVFSGSIHKCPFHNSGTSPARSAMDLIKNYWGEAPWLDKTFVKTADHWEIEDLGLQMFSAGMAGLRNCITMGIYYLSLNWNEVKANMDLWLANISLIAEEIIRLTTPLLRIRRVLSSDIEMHDVKMKKNDHVYLWLISANMDENIFEHPLKFVPFRRPNPHLSFSSGLHSCLGFSLARMEVEEILKSIIRNWKSLEVIDAPSRFKSSVVNEISSMKIRIA